MTRTPLQPPRPLTPDDARTQAHAALRRAREAGYGFGAKRPPECDAVLAAVVDLNIAPDAREAIHRAGVAGDKCAALHAWLDAKAAGDTGAASGGTGWRVGMVTT